MLTRVDNVLTRDELARIAGVFETVACVAGRTSAQGRAAEVKDNLQLPRDHRDVQGIAQLVLDALRRSQQFFAATYARRACPPLFSRYEPGMAYGEHVDNAVMATPAPVRTDIAVTLFLCDPAGYDGGELVVKMGGGETAVKLPAGSLVAYPPHFVHRVAPVTRGVRLAAITWVESMLRSAEQREVMRGLDESLQRLRAQGADAATLTPINNAYHTLMRMWCET